MDKNKLLRKGLARLLSVLMILSTIGAGLTALGFGPMEAYASSLEGIQKGNTVKMGVENAYYTGTPDWTVLKVDDEDNDGSADKALVIAKKLWTGDGTSDAAAKIKFAASSNAWDGSDAKAWCEGFYSNILLNSSLVASTDINDAADDTYGACTSTGNKVFFLSAKEAQDNLASLTAKYEDGTTGKWWLRSPDKSTTNKVAQVSDSGTITVTYPQITTTAARPAFWLDLSSDFCAAKSGSGISTTWTINVNSTNHSYGTPNYSWAEDNSECTASATCSQCSNEIIETATATSSVSGNTTTYTAEFENSAFTTQTKDVEAQAVKPENVYMARHDEVEEFQEASGGTFKWTATNADWSLYDPLIEMVDESDFQLQTKKVTDSEWTDVQGELTVSAYSDSGDEDIVTITAAIPDNTADYDISWRVIYKHSEVSLQIEEGVPIHITQKHPEAQAVKPETVYMARHDDVEEFQPASGGTFMWIAMNADYSLEDPMIDLVEASDFQLQTKKVTDSEWTDTQGDLTVSAFSESGDEELVTITAAIPDNTADYDISWRVIYKHCDVSLQNPSCESFHITQMKPEPAAKPGIYQVYITSENQQPAAGGTYTWAFYGDDDSADWSGVTSEDFSAQVKVGDGEWTASDATVTLSANDEYDGVVTISVPDNDQEVEKQWRFTYAGGIFDYNDDPADCPAIKQAAKETPPAEKPVIGDVYILSGNTQPAAGGTYSWAFFGVDDTDDWSGVTSEDFSAQVKVGDGAWTASSATATLSANDEYDGVVTISVPDNDQEVEKQWRFTYAGGIVDYNDDPADCPAIKQAAAEPPAPTKPALVVAPDSESVSADGGEISWGVWDHEYNDLELTNEDFTVMVDSGNGPEAAEGVTAEFEVGNNDDEGTVSVTVPANSEQVEKKWSLSYDGDIYVQQGEGFTPATAWPYITQAAKPAVEPAVEEVVGKIDALPDAAAVTAADEEAIAAARAAYDALTDEQKATVDDTKLKAAEVALKTIKDNAAADNVKGLINALPAADKVTTADKDKIEAAKAAYDALTDDQKALIDADTAKKLTDAQTALSDAQKAADAAAAEARAKKVKTVTVNVTTVNAKAIDKVVKSKGGSSKYVTKIILGSKVKKISPKAFAKYKKVTVVEVKTKKLTKKSVKNSMKSSKVKTIKVKVSKKSKINKKYIKKYKSIFVKKNVGKKVKVK